MSSVFSIAVSGLKAQSTRLAVSADNVVNAGSLGQHTDPNQAKPEAYVPKQTQLLSLAGGGVQAQAVPISPASYLSLEPNDPNADASGLVPRPNVSLEQEMVTQIQALRMFQANIRVIKTQDEMLGSLLNIKS